MIKIEFDERDLRSLRVFCGVVQAGGFALAERTLLMSKASISRHVRAVEERLGVTLCERGPSGFRLTVEGEVAARLAFDAIRSLEKIKSEIDAVHSVMTGSISIGLGDYLVFHPDFKLSEAISKFNTLAPSVDFNVSIMTFNELNRALREQSVDIVVRGKYASDKDFSYLPLFVESHVLYVLNSVTSGQASLLPMVMRNHPYVNELMLTSGSRPGPKVNDIEAMIVLIGSGLYKGLLPSHIAAILKTRYPIKRLRGSPDFTHPMCAITNKHKPLSRKVEVFLSVLEELHTMKGISSSSI